MKIDLQKDYKKIMVERIQKSGLKVPNKYGDDKLIIHYITYLRKKAFAGPHKIEKAKDFNIPKGFERGLNKLGDIIKNGGDITPYFNRTASNLSEFDDLFSDWGILHFHLGDEFIKGKHLVKRGNPVLFAYHNNETIYFIGIYNHGHWTDYEVVQKMYDNWPEIIEPFIYNGEMSLACETPSSGLKKLREAGVFAFFQIKDASGNNLCLMPPGWGLNSARSANQDTRIYDDAMNKLRDIELDLIPIESKIKQDMKDQGIPVNQEICLEMIDFNERELYLIDSNHQFQITIGH